MSNHDTFLPFNFSTVTSFDTLSVALSELPIPQRAEPSGPLSAHGIDANLAAPSSATQAEMLDIITETARHSEWFPFTADELKDFRNVEPSAEPDEQWLKPFCDQLASKLIHTTKRHLSNPRIPSPRRSTPKRPRTSPVLSDNYSKLDMPLATGASSAPMRKKGSPYTDTVRVVQPSTPRRLKVRKHVAAHNTPSPSQPLVHTQSVVRPPQRPEVSDEREKRMRLMEKDIDADEFNAFIDYISRFVRQTAKHDRDIQDAHMFATSNVSRVSELRQHIEIFATKGAIGHIEPRLLSEVIRILQTRIAHGVGTCSKLKKRQLSKASSTEALPSVVCASTVLSILCAPGCARSLLVEELLESIVALIEEVSMYIIFPICDPLYKPSQKLGKRNKSKKNSRPSKSGENTNDEDSSVDYEEGNLERRRSGTRRTILKRDEALFDQAFVLLDALSTLHGKEHFLPHSVVSRLARVCVHSLSVTGVERFQSHAIKTACTIFASYPDHRVQILDGVREAASSVPAARRHLRCFKIGEDQTTVRASSAIFAQLVCIASSDPVQNLPLPPKSRTASSVENDLISVRKTRHGRALKAAVHVLDPLLVRVCSDRDPEYRTAFTSLLEDLLILYGRPEWPSAELILQTLSVSVITRFRSPEDKAVHTKCTFLDILGSLASRMCELYGVDVLNEIQQSVSFDIKVEVLEMERETLLLYLDPNRSLQAAAANSFYDALFLVDDHNIAKNLRRRARLMNQERNMSDLHDDEEVIDGQDGSTEVEKSTMVALEEISRKRAENVAARRMRNEEITRSDALRAACFIGKNRSFTSGFSTILQSILDGLHDSAPTVRAKSIKALSSVDNSCQGLLCQLPNVLNYIEASCRDVSTLARDAALDLISRSLLQQVGPQHSISSDVSKNDGKHDPVLMSRIFSVVEKRLCDTATSVRKRAISIMRSILLGALQNAEELRLGAETPIDAQARVQIHEARIVQVCTNLVSRLEDPEPTVKEAAERTLRLGLFGFDISQELFKYDPSDVDKANQLANRLIAVFARLPHGIHTSFLSRITHRSLLIKQKGLLASILNAAVERLHASEAKAVSLTGNRDRKGMTKEEHTELRHLSTEKVACSSIINAFAGLDPTLITSHCRALAPAIKVMEGKLENDDIHCIQRVLNVLEVGVGTAKDIDTSFVEEVMHDIDIIVCTSPVAALEEAAVKCFCAIARKSGLKSCQELVHRSASAFRTFLTSNMENLRSYFERNMPEEMAWLERNARVALIRLGLLARYGDFEPACVEQIYETLAATSEAVAVMSSRDALAQSAVRGLSHFLIRNRSYLQRGTRILVSFFESPKSADEATSEASEPPSEKPENFITSYSEGVQFYVLQGFHDLLRDEEERNSASKIELGTESRKRKRSEDRMMDEEICDRCSESSEDCSANSLKQGGSRVMLAAEEDTEAGFLALSAQLMVPHLQKAVLHSSHTIRRTVANIFGLLVRQGLLLPATVVTSLFILLLDRDTRCRELACRVVNFLADRHAGMFAAAALPALRTCFEASFDLLSMYNSKQSNEKEDVQRHDLMQQCNEDHRGLDHNGVVDSIISMAVDQKSGMSLLSQALMSMRREQRRGVLECIMKEFDPRVSVRFEAATENSNETMVIDDDSGAKLANGGGAQTGSDDDEDVGQVRKGVMDVYGPAKICALPTLYFLAVTIACIDYTNGAGIGGSLTQGGGTAAAEAKLKIAKEDVSELVAIATRIVSNSGQAVLQVTKQLLRSNNASAEKWRRLCVYATRMSLLLSLKQHLKFSRWKAAMSNEEGKMEQEGNRATCRLPSFRPDGRTLELLCGGGATGDGVDGHEEGAWREQLERFCKLMRDDAIDEADVRGSGRKSSKRGRASGGGGRRRSSKAGAGRHEVRVETGVARKYKLHRRASVTKVVYEVDSNSDKDSDYQGEE